MILQTWSKAMKFPYKDQLLCLAKCCQARYYQMVTNGIYVTLEVSGEYQVRWHRKVLAELLMASSVSMPFWPLSWHKQTLHHTSTLAVVTTLILCHAQIIRPSYHISHFSLLSTHFLYSLHIFSQHDNSSASQTIQDMISFYINSIPGLNLARFTASAFMEYFQ